MGVQSSSNAAAKSQSPIRSGVWTRLGIRTPWRPDTGQPLKGFQLPDWDQALALCLEFAMAFHKLRYQSWDIALCPDGPVFVEVNTGSAFNLSQLATAKGFLTDRFRAFLESCGY